MTKELTEELALRGLALAHRLEGTVLAHALNELQRPEIHDAATRDSLLALARGENISQEERTEVAKQLTAWQTYRVPRDPVDAAVWTQFLQAVSDHLLV